jgi:homoserine O-succinyltransferase
MTGREPSTANLRDEPYWKSFTDVVTWARENTHSAIWSCLAAHAAILHMDGIDRCRSDHKHFGVYDCERISNHSLTAGVSPHFRSPHSRWNGLAEPELSARGYRVLTRSVDAGVDMFIKEENSLFVFLQGHPEYDSHTLLREYRRDVGRYLRCETNSYPSLPRDYFEPSTALALNELREKALSNRSAAFAVQLTSTLERIEVENTWRATAVRLYRNWLDYICARKNAGQQDEYEDPACAAS